VGVKGERRTDQIRNEGKLKERNGGKVEVYRGFPLHWDVSTTFYNVIMVLL